MARKLFFDLESLDPDRFVYSIDEIRRYNAQRFEFEQLTGILHLDLEGKTIVGLRRIGDDEFWRRGHIPGQPLFPGVLIVEAAAQLCSFFSGKAGFSDGFFGFGGLESVRFRGAVGPGDDLLLAARPLVLTARGSKFETQGVVDGRLVYEGTVIGVRMPAPAAPDNPRSA